MRSAAARPERGDGSHVVFTPVRHGDLPMLAEWLARPHWREWWGDPEEELGHIRDMIEGRDDTRPFIFHVGGHPSGYIQVWRIGPHQTPDWIADHPWLAELPADAVGVDLAAPGVAVGVAALGGEFGHVGLIGHGRGVLQPLSER